jgi:hypothetical protein
MNERIEKLALQAGFNLHNDVIDGHDFKHEIEKFAELIVKECADIAGAAEPYKAEDLIKKHFGVEE